MSTLKALALAGAVAALAPSLAAAADLALPPVYEPAPVVEASYSGWYLRGDVGVGVSARDELRTSTFAGAGALPGCAPGSASSYCIVDQRIGHAFFAGAGIGYQFNAWLRGDVTAEIRGGHALSGVDEANYPIGYLGQTYAGTTRNYYSGSLTSKVVLANAYADLGTWYGITPFVGVGAGVAHNEISLHDQGFSYNTFSYIGSPSGGYFPKTSKTNFAWALMAGLGYSVTPNLKLEIGYRYLDLGKVTTGHGQCFNPGAGSSDCGYAVSLGRQADHDIKIGMRWMLAADTAQAPAFVVPPPPPCVAPCGQRPIVRKY